jgi:hypothetical protein
MPRASSPRACASSTPRSAHIASRREVFECVPGERRANRELAQAGERSVAQRFLEPLALRFAEAAHDMEAEPRRALVIDEAVKFARVDCDRLYDDAVPACVVDQHFG